MPCRDSSRVPWRPWRWPTHRWRLAIHPLSFFLAAPFDRPWWEGLPIELAALGLGVYLEHALSGLHPANEALGLLASLAAGEEAGTLDLDAVYGEQARGCLADAKTPDALSVAAMAELVLGEADVAAVHFAAALRRLQREPGKGKAALLNLHSVMYAIALVGDGEQGHLAAAAGYLEPFTKGRAYRERLDWVHYGLRLAVDALRGRGVTPRGWFKPSQAGTDPSADLLLGVAACWMGVDVPRELRDALMQLAERGKQAGYLSSWTGPRPPATWWVIPCCSARTTPRSPWSWWCAGPPSRWWRRRTAICG
jgi:hypothetical protein